MRRTKRAVLILATLVVLVLTGCTTPSSPPATSTVVATASVPPKPTGQVFDTLDRMVGRWKVTYTLASVKPASMRKATVDTPTNWECIVYNGELRLVAGARAYTGQIVATPKKAGKDSWNYKGQANYAGGAGESWTSDIVVDATMLTSDSFSAKETGTVTSSVQGKVFTATWKVKGTRIP